MPPRGKSSSADSSGFYNFAIPLGDAAEERYARGYAAELTRDDQGYIKSGKAAVVLLQLGMLSPRKFSEQASSSKVWNSSTRPRTMLGYYFAGSNLKRRTISLATFCPFLRAGWNVHRVAALREAVIKTGFA
jgi:hypothetical protein